MSVNITFSANKRPNSGGWSLFNPLTTTNCASFTDYARNSREMHESVWRIWCCDEWLKNSAAWSCKVEGWRLVWFRKRLPRLWTSVPRNAILEAPQQLWIYSIILVFVSRCRVRKWISRICHRISYEMSSSQALNQSTICVWWGFLQ